MRAGFTCLASVALLAGCTTAQPPVVYRSAAPIQTNPTLPAIACSDGNSTIDSDFLGSAMAGCQVVREGHYRLQIRQEDRNVENCSAYYAFRIQARQPSDLLIDLDYEKCGHRYEPKLWVASPPDRPCENPLASKPRTLVSLIERLIERQRGNCKGQGVDVPEAGGLWAPLSSDAYVVTPETDAQPSQARIALTAGSDPKIVSSQELLLPSEYVAWIDALESRGAINRRVLGQSLEGRPIEMFQVGNVENPGRSQLVLVGRQHPPEVTGSLAMFAFVERLLENDKLALEFRAKVTTSVVPLLNPDGVVRGHWRHSKGERDLNRDWGPFTQPETRLVRDLMEMMEADPRKDIRFFIDFHSTWRDLIYTLDKSLVTNPPGFTDEWIADYQKRLPGYEVEERPGHNPDRPVSKGWGYERFGIPTMTYEIGDETDRELIRKVARAAAETTMTTMLAHESAAQ